MNTEISSRAATPQEKPLTGAGLPQVADIMAKYSDAGDKGVVGGYNGTFPLTAATKGNIYLLPSTGKYYKCITDYSGQSLSVPNANFEDLSVAKNSDKLENLCYSLYSSEGAGINTEIIKPYEDKILKINHNNTNIPCKVNYVNSQIITFNNSFYIQFCIGAKFTDPNINIKIPSDYVTLIVVSLKELTNLCKVKPYKLKSWFGRSPSNVVIYSNIYGDAPDISDEAVSDSNGNIHINIEEIILPGASNRSVSIDTISITTTFFFECEWI